MMSRLFKLMFLLVISFQLSSCVESGLILDGNYSVYGTSDIIAGMSFPPFSNSEQINFTVTEIKKMAIDRIRTAVDWRNREPIQGTFYWDPMDVRMNTAKENNISVFLTIINLCPDWAQLSSGSDGACIIDESALQTFIEKLLERYDNIDKIQFGNEWESGAEDGTVYMDPNSIEKFVTYNNILYDTVQRLSPDTKVVLGGLTREYPIVEYFARNGSYPDFSGISLANGATVEDLEKKVDKIKTDYESKGIKQNIEYVFQNAKYDILDIHLYDDPENWPEYLTVIPDGKPVLVSEFGGPNSEFEKTSPDYQADRMEYYIDAIEALPIIEAYYFKLVESDSSYHKDSGLFFSNSIIKPARNAFAGRLRPMW
ncbi:MAG: cellulase family glycosylhydrolase [Spirochaetales bacterium]|nr:cellulase family glycosylhydrolase [Spirochaetales bacterium]